MINKLVDKDITLDEVMHKYSLVSDPTVVFTSCTTFIKYFFKAFDSIGIANNLVARHPNYIGMSPQELVEVWDKKAEVGSIVHNEIDMYIKNDDIPKLDKSILAVNWLNNYFNNGNQIYSEVILYAKELQLAGTVDLLVYNKSMDSYEIFDWKTSKKIDKNSYGNKMGITKATSKLMDCNFIHYSLQLSLYRYILEEYYNLSISKTTILHINDTEVIHHESKYYKTEIEEMLKYDKGSLQEKAESSLTKEYINPL